MRRIDHFIALLPEGDRRWVESHLAELQVIDSRWGRVRWRLGLVPMTLAVLFDVLFRRQLTHEGARTMKRLTFLGSSVVAIAGLTLLLIWAVADQPSSMLWVGALTTAIGTTTLAALRTMPHRLSRSTGLTTGLIGLLVGLAGVGFGTLQALQPGNADPEYGPIALLAIVAINGLVTVITFVDRSRSQVASG